MWDPKDYDNITDTRLPWDRVNNSIINLGCFSESLFQVWTPDIVLYNAAGDGEQGREMRTLIQVKIERYWTIVMISSRLITKAM